ncbi:MAG: hypothetical protein CM1200mP36_03490 [Gammaproteobacteria bacterium]|nr:MAG: hypothetical protein CM1200mP36_03490 [Gammaproteobacteria bacterium]
MSYVEPGDGDTRGAAVARAELSLSGNRGEFTDLEVVWRKYPKLAAKVIMVIESHLVRMVICGSVLGIAKKFYPSQDLGTNIGKVVRLNMDGSVPGDNPFDAVVVLQLRLVDGPS